MLQRRTHYDKRGFTTFDYVTYLTMSYFYSVGLDFGNFLKNLFLKISSYIINFSIKHQDCDIKFFSILACFFPFFICMSAKTY